FGALLKKGNEAPYSLAIDAISSSSVETITSSNNPHSSAASMEYAIIGLPRKSLIFFLGIRLLPPLAGMMARLPNGYLIVFVNLPDNKLLLFCCQCGIHGQADTMPVIVLSMWHIILLPSKLPVIRHQVYRDVVDL